MNPPHAEPVRKRSKGKAVRRSAALLACIGAALVLGAAARSAAPRPGPSFAAAKQYAIGGNPTAVVVGDLNGDGKPDLVTLSEKAGTLSVLLNRGDGSFGPSRDYPTGDGPEALVIADLNGDGKPDLMAANFFGDTVSMLLNLGAGSFAAKHDYRVGIHFAPTSIAVGDLNADGKPDLVAAKLADGTVSVLLNRGDGSFKRRRDYPAGPEPLAVSIADLNRDGKPDLAANNQTGNAVSILVNHGDASFEPRRAYSAAGPGVIADLNIDGRPDLVSAFRAHKGSTISVRINTPGLCNVQSVVGTPLADAKLMLARVNCRVGKVRRAYSRVKKGHVISQKPRFAAVRPGGAKVNIVVSRGRKH
jgi:hypothetical protein